MHLAGLYWSLPIGWAPTLASAAVAFAVPLLLAGVGECIVERAGVINIGVEGLMLTAAFAAVAGSHAAGSAWVGLVAGVLAAMLLGALFGAITIYRHADQVVAGTALNILALGLTGAAFFALSQRLAAHGGSHLNAAKLPDWPLPLLAGLPVLGQTLFTGNLLVYLSFLLVPATAWGLDRSRLGLRLRAVGEFPHAAEASGVNVHAVRFAAVLTGAGLAGMAGAFLSIGHVASFADNMTAGKGFIALALVIFGRWKPWGVLAGAAVFSLAWGFATVLSTRGRGAPEEVFLLALPYLATLLALFFRIGRSAAPAALAQPYVRQ